jgi:hypothetical protein
VYLFEVVVLTKSRDFHTETYEKIRRTLLNVKPIFPGDDTGHTDGQKTAKKPRGEHKNED